VLVHPLRSSDPAATALERGDAYAELDGHHLVLVSGTDARAWLHDLVTTDVASLGRFQSRPGLLLSPTGRIRATAHVLGVGDRDLVLAQPPGQPDPIDELLVPYVLSSDVHLGPTRLRPLSVPGRTEPPAWARRAWRPSVLGGGFDLLVGADDEPALEDVRALLEGEGLEPAGPGAVEIRRIHRGEPRFPVDLDVDSLPGEAGWDSAPVTDRTKGCFLGQESVAKVANLGHPPRVVLAVEADGPLEPGAAVLAGGSEVGAVTSTDGEVGLARVRWEARELPLTASGRALRQR
jgi:folate-binding protein YgfZ